MPGILGILSRQTVGDEESLLNSMLKSLLYEPFYAGGTYIDKQRGFYVGFVTIQGSFSDCMPIFNEDRTLVLFLTGECYVDDSVLADLRRKGHDVDGERAGFLVHLYEERREAFFRDLNGWYNGLLLDLNERRAFLFNDRYGIRRIYYHENERGFFFSSEAKALLRAFPELRVLNDDSVAEFLVYDAVLDNKSYFKNIRLLPPGAVWTFGQGMAGVKKDSYVDVNVLENQPPLGQGEFEQNFMDLFEEILPRYFRGQGIGMSLTGGLDTRLIMACQRPEAGRLPCYTFGGKYRNILDVRLAPEVAKLCHQEHHVLLLDDEAYLKEYPEHLARSIYVSDGIESVDKADVIYFNKLARHIAPIRMSGKYGSQVLKSVFGFQDRTPDSRLIDEGFAAKLDGARSTCAELKRTHPFSFLLFKEIPWWWNGFIASESSQVSIRSPYLDNDLVKLLYRAPSLRSLDGSQLQLKAIGRFNPKLLKVPTTGSYGGVGFPLVVGLRKRRMRFLMNLDKMQIREKLPYSLTHTVGRLDYVLHKLSLDRVISGFVDFRRYRVWYRDQLGSFIEETLLDRRTLSRPYWNRVALTEMVRAHRHGKGTYLREIRKVLQIEMIHRVLCEDKG